MAEKWGFNLQFTGSVSAFAELMQEEALFSPGDFILQNERNPAEWEHKRRRRRRVIETDVEHEETDMLLLDRKHSGVLSKPVPLSICVPLPLGLERVQNQPSFCYLEQ